MNDRKRFLRIFIILTIFGLVSLLGTVGKAGFEAIRLVDAVRLIGTGMCFGAAIEALVFYVRSPRPS